MKQIRYNEVKDLLDQKEIMYIEGEYSSLQIQMPNLGECTYWAKKDKLHIHKKNEWIHDGYYALRNLLTGETKNIIELDWENYN